MKPVQLPAGWTAVNSERGQQLEHELRRELPKSHRLRNVALETLATHDADDDDVLFQAVGEQAVYWVHLTWNVERDPTWPYTVAYDDVADFNARWGEEAI
jgi:hypothetical protein